MERAKIARINELAHKAKTSGQTQAELAERDALGTEQLPEVKATASDLIDQMEHTTVVEPDGTRHKLLNRS